MLESSGAQPSAYDEVVLEQGTGGGGRSGTIMGYAPPSESGYPHDTWGMHRALLQVGSTGGGGGGAATTAE